MDNSDCRVAHKPHRAPLRWILAVKFHTKRRGTLREHPKFKTIPILILTTESSDQMKQAGRAAGATGWLVKPFDPNRLIEVIQKVIR